MAFLLKTLMSGVVITFAAWLSGSRPALAGFIIAMPMMSMLAILFSYMQYHDMEKVNQFALSIVTAVPLSLVFFLPFLFNRWWKLNFFATYVLAIGLLAAAYFFHHWLLKS